MSLLDPNEMNLFLRDRGVHVLFDLESVKIFTDDETLIITPVPGRVLGHVRVIRAAGIIEYGRVSACP